ncbi:MAG TPA: radical SAM protein [Verrucomicrobiales bacterium]|nr:radical SAM protein [Verrucomicrobiales bacterium]
MNRFERRLAVDGLELRRAPLETLQLNLGFKCNQACRHCHVDAAPWRTEMMDAPTAVRVSDWIRRHRPGVVDITGGAPEMNPNFRALVQVAVDSGARVMDRNNLTILQEPGFEWLPEFLASRRVEIIASLPCYLEKNVNQQRGNGVFLKSIESLRSLNRLGYGDQLVLNLVYNPLGGTLPPAQAELEADYRDVLWREHQIRFHRLFTLTNQPIARFAADLRSRGCYEEYMELLVSAFNPGTVSGLMCRSTLSVDYQGRLFDCDFNQMLGLPAPAAGGAYLWDLDPARLAGGTVRTAEHCLACTAGCGSSCGGALQQEASSVRQGGAEFASGFKV